MKNAKKLAKELSDKKCKIVHRQEMFKVLEKLIKQREKEKAKYISIKEFNTWSTALGWKQYEKETTKDVSRNDFKVYIEDKEFYAPTGWVKKKADNGEILAIKEMQRRSAFVNHENIETAKAKARGRVNVKRDIIKYNNDEPIKSDL